MLRRIFLILAATLAPITRIAAVSVDDIGLGPWSSDTSLIQESMTLIGVLSLIQSILLKVVLPILVVGTALYVAYLLFTADGDETKMKQAWKSVTFSAIALIIIALAYALVAVFSNIAI
jgi:hypothetical protein